MTLLRFVALMHLPACFAIARMSKCYKEEHVYIETEQNGCQDLQIVSVTTYTTTENTNKLTKPPWPSTPLLLPETPLSQAGVAIYFNSVPLTWRTLAK
jgi:hypothetical protein